MPLLCSSSNYGSIENEEKRNASPVFTWFYNGRNSKSWKASSSRSYACQQSLQQSWQHLHTKDNFFSAKRVLTLLPLFDPLCWYFSTVFLVPSICFGILLQLIYHFRKWYQNMHGTWHAPLEMSFFEETEEDIESQQFSFQFGHWQIAGDMVEMLSWTEIHDWFHFSRIDDKRFVQIFSYELLLLLLTLFCFINTIPTQYFHLCRFFYVV